MGINVGETKRKIYTDISEDFFEGMKKEDAEKENSIFNNRSKNFDRIDEDRDSKLSHKEITYELQDNIAELRKNRKNAWRTCLIFSILGIITRKSSSKLYKYGLPAYVFYNLSEYFYRIPNKIKELNQRLAQGYN